MSKWAQSGHRYERVAKYPKIAAQLTVFDTVILLRRNGHARKIRRTAWRQAVLESYASQRNWTRIAYHDDLGNFSWHAWVKWTPQTDAAKAANTRDADTAKRQQAITAHFAQFPIQLKEE